jgi:hypothetical protein
MKRIVTMGGCHYGSGLSVEPWSRRGKGEGPCAAHGERRTHGISNMAWSRTGRACGPDRIGIAGAPHRGYGHFSRKRAHALLGAWDDSLGGYAFSRHWVAGPVLTPHCLVSGLPPLHGTGRWQALPATAAC